MDQPEFTRGAVARFGSAAKMRSAWVALLIVGVTAAFFVLFAWDHERKYPVGETSGPYAFWQVALMTALLLALTVGAARQGMPLLPTLTIPPVLAFWFAWEWSQTDDSGLYGVGVILLAIGSFLGVGLVAIFARNFFAAQEIGTKAAPEE